MSTLRDFLERRRSEIVEQLRPLEEQRLGLDAQISALVSEIRELDSAANAIGMVNGLHQESDPVDRLEKPTIKEAIMTVLRGHDRGLSALDILQEIRDQIGLDIERTSLSPQLSRLKNDRLVDRRGMMWFIADRNRTYEASPTTQELALRLERALKRPITAAN